MVDPDAVIGLPERDQAIVHVQRVADPRHRKEHVTARRGGGGLPTRGLDVSEQSEHLGVRLHGDGALRGGFCGRGISVRERHPDGDRERAQVRRKDRDRLVRRAAGRGRVAGLEREFRGAGVQPGAALRRRVVDRIGPAHRAFDVGPSIGETAGLLFEPRRDDVERRIVAIRSRDSACARDVAQLQVERCFFRRQAGIVAQPDASASDRRLRFAEAVQREQRAGQRGLAGDVTARLSDE